MIKKYDRMITGALSIMLEIVFLQKISTQTNNSLLLIKYSKELDSRSSLLIHFRSPSYKLLCLFKRCAET